MKKVHPFSRTLGPGPYKFGGVGRIVMNETFGAKYFGPEVDGGGGTCYHCGHAILNIYVVINAEGKRYGVGSDCIAKLNLPFEILSAAEKAKKEMERKKRRERAEKRRERYRKEKTARLAELRERLSDEGLRARLAEKPHPNEFMASQGLTLLSYVDWNMERGNDGAIQKILEDFQLDRESGR